MFYVKDQRKCPIIFGYLPIRYHTKRSKTNVTAQQLQQTVTSYQFTQIIEQTQISEKSPQLYFSNRGSTRVYSVTYVFQQQFVSIHPVLLNLFMLVTIIEILTSFSIIISVRSVIFSQHDHISFSPSISSTKVNEFLIDKIIKRYFFSVGLSVNLQSLKHNYRVLR